MKNIISAIFLIALAFACADSNEPNNPTDPGTTDFPDGVTPSRTSLTTFVFGHSLIVHEPPAIPTPSDETSVPHWLASLSNAAQFDYSVAGQYGFLPQHADLPPFAQWGFDLATAAWDSDTQEFSDADFNTVLLTAGNFIQYQPATTNYYQMDISPVDATISIIDWVESQEPGIQVYIYENWPDMAPFLSNDFPPASVELAAYHNNTKGEFHQWWLDYHDEIVAARPDLNVKMIPVGPILADILELDELSEMPITDVYEDDAPHGRPTVYFLAGLVTYMSMYGTPPPADYQVPSTVHSTVASNYALIVSEIWEGLLAFNDESGSSRVF